MIRNQVRTPRISNDWQPYGFLSGDLAEKGQISPNGIIKASYECDDDVRIGAPQIEEND